MIFALLPVLVIQVLMVASFDMYPWGKYDFKETSDDLLDLLRESEHLNVWESTLASTLPTSKDYLVLKNSEGNTFQLGRKSPASATRGSTLKQANDLKSISAALENTCGMFVDGFWTYEWCHG